MAWPLRISLQTGIHLAQIGEFSFVLAMAGKSAGLISENHYQIFPPTSVITTILTPFLLQASPSISAWVSSKKLLDRLDRMRKRGEPIFYGEIPPSPDPDFVFKRGDVVYLIGEREKVLKAIELIESSS